MKQLTINPIQEDQIRALLNNAYTAGVGNAIAVLIVYGALFLNAGSTYAGILCLILLLLIIFRAVIASMYFTDEAPSFSRYVIQYGLFTLLLGISWSLLTVIFYNQLANDYQLFLSIINIGLVSASVGTLAFCLPIYFMFVLPLVAGVTLMNFMTGNPYIAVAMLVFAWVMVMVAIRSNKNFKHSCQLIQENKALIAEMKNHQQELEAEVSLRTQELLIKNKDLSEQILRRQVIEQELEHLAYYDVLTGLPNRALLIDRLNKAISLAQREETLLGVLFIDLDRFKNFNDSLGHEFGDAILSEVAGRLKKLLRESDTIARNGGDEFVVVIEHVREVREVFLVAEKIIKAINQPFEIDQHNVHIGASIGIALYPLDDNNPHELLKMADTAMYCAKKDGGDQFEFYSQSMSSQIRDRIELETRLRLALQNNDFYLMYQPQVNLHTGETTGFEALLRWHDAELGQVSPARFVPVLEESGLIYQVGEWVIEEAVRFIAKGRAGECSVSVNLSALQCAVTGLSQKISQIIETSQIRPSQLEFELTESVLINNFEKTERFLTEIHKIGCTIALDDFGTGYTSMNYLARLPIDVIKIDRSLVSQIDSNENLVKIVKAIVTMSQSLGIKNVFEGIETAAELDVIRNLKGSIIQGYYFSKPLLLEQIDEWLARKQAC